MINEIKKILENEKYHQLATVSKDGIPNVCTIGAIIIQDDNTIVIVDNYFNKTKKNVLNNSNVALLFRYGKKAYQVKGLCSYVNEGQIYNDARNWMKQKGDKYPAKGALVISITDIYNSSAGVNAGKKIR